jgi:predicted RNA-binding Zn-ribbon protein involved in translation (DUF1610 family)
VVDWVKLSLNFRGANTVIVVMMTIFKQLNRRDPMKRRLTGNELFRLRNLIPIDMLIKEQLNMESKMSEGYLRFLCPLCGEFQTATNAKTNLARCFRCEKNFNPIDLVMVVKAVGFIESVHYLKKLLPTMSDEAVAQAISMQVRK